MTTLTKIFLSITLSAASALAAQAESAADNPLILDLDPALNPVQIVQTDRAAGNNLTLTVLGEGNGGFGSVWPMPALFDQAPAPGTLLQSGQNNSATLRISGQDNFFAVMQSGQGHQLVGAVSGQGNAAAITQSGQGQRAQFRQHGLRNALAISQTSWYAN